MAKDFGKMNKGKIEEIAKKSNTMANVVSVKMIHTDDLIDCPENNEDLSYTEDVETSINESGFVDAIIVTDIGCEDGKYMILSGHRRRVAGVKLGIKTFPCVVKHFKDYASAVLYCKMGNITRPQTPTRMAIRYKGIEEALKLNGFKGSMREEIATRMGLKVAQADRYNQLNKVILPFWDLINEEVIGMSAVTDSGLYTHSVEEQEEMLTMFNEAREQGVRLNREVCKEIVVAYRNGKRSWNEMSAGQEQTQTEAPKPFMNLPTNDDNSSDDDNSDDVVNPLARNNETNYDTSHRENLPSGVDPYADERLNDDDMEVINNSNSDKGNKDKQEDDRPKEIQQGEKVIKALNNLEGILEEIYKFETKEKSKTAIRTLGTMSELLVDNMESILGDNDFDKELEQVLLTSLTSLEKNVVRIKEVLNK